MRGRRREWRGCWLRAAGSALACAIALAPPARAELAPETATTVRLDAAARGPHAVWVGDIAFGSLVAGKASLFDADSGRMLGMLSTGYFFIDLDLPRDGREIYAVETYFSRGTRGTRSDVVSIYDPAELRAVGEVPLPPKRATNLPFRANSALTDDARFLLIYNYAPGTSVSVVDVGARRFVGEIETEGCALVYPSGPRRFHMLCGDGALLTVRLDDDGRALSKERSAPFFEPRKDPVTEKAVRVGSRWLFATFEGWLHEVDVSGDEPRFSAPWSLFDEADRAGRWRIGGLQHLAVHAPSGRLYSLVHQGGPGSHKDPGRDVFVYDLGARRRVQRIALAQPAGALLVTPDAKPLLLAAFLESRDLEVYDATSGTHLRTIPEVGETPTLLQSP